MFCFYFFKGLDQLLLVCTWCNTLVYSFNVVLQEVSPHVIITSAKQEHCMTRFLQQLGEFWGTNMICKWRQDRPKTPRKCFKMWVKGIEWDCVFLTLQSANLIRGRSVSPIYYALPYPAFTKHNSAIAKQPLSITYCCCFPASNPDYRPEVVIYPYADFGNQQTYPET